MDPKWTRLPIVFKKFGLLGQSLNSKHHLSMCRSKGCEMQKFGKNRTLNSEYPKSELRISNIQTVHDLTEDLWVIHAKFRPPVITVTALNCKNSKISEKFEILTSNFEYPNSEKPCQRPMDPCKISATCDHCYGCD